MIGNFRLPVGSSSSGSVAILYTRPADWLVLPPITSGQQKAVMLHAVFDHDSNFCAFQCASNYTVDWGDGIVENFNANVSAYHKFTYANHAGTECDRGYRQAIVTVTPQATFNLTKFDFYIKHNQAGLGQYKPAWLDVKMAGSSISVLKFDNGFGENASVLLESFDFKGTNAITSLQYCFSACRGLQYVNLYTNSVTNFTGTHNYNLALRTAPAYDTRSANNMNGMFTDCYSLEVGYLYNTALVTNMNAMHQNNFSLSNIPLYNLVSVISCTNFASFCARLLRLPLLNTSTQTTLQNMVNSCSAIQIIPAIDFGGITSSAGMPNLSLPSLSKMSAINIKWTFTLANAKMSAPALVEVFNNLATITGQTITISGNWGASLLTAPERAIATGKGWTIVG
jgi:hypothetical protein